MTSQSGSGSQRTRARPLPSACANGRLTSCSPACSWVRTLLPSVFRNSVKIFRSEFVSRPRVFNMSWACRFVNKIRPPRFATSSGRSNASSRLETRLRTAGPFAGCSIATLLDTLDSGRSPRSFPNQAHIRLEDTTLSLTCESERGASTLEGMMLAKGKKRVNGKCVLLCTNEEARGRKTTIMTGSHETASLLTHCIILKIKEQKIYQTVPQCCIQI